MDRVIYRYSFPKSVPLDDVESALFLAILGAQCMVGECRVRLDSPHLFDRSKRACVIDAGTPAGSVVALLLCGLLQHELGGDAFQVKRVEPQEIHT